MMDTFMTEYGLYKSTKCYLTKSAIELSALTHCFCSTYLTAVKKLLNDINAAKNIEEKRSIFKCFTNKYTTVPDIWLAWRNFEKEDIRNVELFFQNREIFKKLKNESLKHFYMDYTFDTDIIYDIILNKNAAKNQKAEFAENEYFAIFKYVKELNYICEYKNLLYAKPIVHKRFEKRDIKNKDFTDFWKTCEEYSTMEILKPTKRKVEEYILVKESLKQKNDDIKWMEMLTKKGKSKACIIQFIETRICNDPFNQILWNLYILYLEKEKSIDVLNVYSRHCRLFTDKISMRSKYFQAAIKFHKNDVNVAKWLMDLVKIEEDFVSITSSINLMEKILTEIYNSKIELPENSNYDEIFAIFKQKIECKNVDSMENEILPTIILRQNFSIPVTVIRSMLNTGSATQIQKLLKCCKYFCIKFKPTVIHKLCLTKIPQNFMYQNSFFVNNRNIEEFTIDNIWLSNSLVIDICIPVVGGINLTKFFFPKIYKCDVRFLCIIDHRLTAAEFDFLTKSEKVESLQLNMTSIIDLEGIEYPLENIIIKCPNAYKFRLSSVPCTSNTAKILSSLNHKTKVNFFDYNTATEEFNVNEFLNFVMKNGTVNSMFIIGFIPNLQFKRMVFHWISSDEKPDITTY